MTKKQLYVGLALCLVMLGVGLRLIPHPANFAPIMATAIFGGAILPRRLGVWVPLAAMVASDMIIGFYDIMPVVWGCYGLVAWVSGRWLARPNSTRIILVTLSASLFFFVATNFAVWAGGSMYEHTGAGLIRCYQMALPFFRNTILSDLIYTGAFFGIFAVVNSMVGRHMRFAERAA